MRLNDLEYSYQIDELKKWGFNILKAAAGMYCSYTIIMVDTDIIDLLPWLISILAIIVFVVAPFALIRSIYRFFKALLKPSKLSS